MSLLRRFSLFSFNFASKREWTLSLNSLCHYMVLGLLMVQQNESFLAKIRNPFSPHYVILIRFSFPFFRVATNRFVYTCYRLSFKTVLNCLWCFYCRFSAGNEYQVTVSFSFSVQKCAILSSCFGRSVASSPPCFLSLSPTGDLTTDRLRDRNKIQSHSREWEKLSGCLRRLVAPTFIWSKGIGCSQSGQVL